MTQNEPDSFGDYTEVECMNNDCDHWVTVHVDDADDEFECWHCNDDTDASEANATQPRVGDMS